MIIDAPLKLTPSKLVNGPNGKILSCCTSSFINEVLDKSLL
jgi:hypothetical protein